MIKPQSSLTSILAAAALASGALLVAVNPAEACIFSKMKQTSVEGANQTPSTLSVNNWKSGKWAAIAAAGVAAVAGLGAVGITSGRRQDPTDILEVPEADAEAASEYMIETVLTEVTVPEETPATETSDRELTLVK